MQKSKNQKEWEKIAERYSIPHIRKVYIRKPSVLKILGDIKGQRIVDLGCGDGYYSRILAGRGAKVIGVDFSKDSIELAKRRETKEKLGIKYYKADISYLPFLKKDYFDIALAEMVIVTIPSQKKYENVVKEVKRILKSKGKIIISKGHPVNFFRRNKSKPYKVTYSKKISYFDSLAQQNVEINIAGKKVRFTDYHRTLEKFLRPWLKNDFLIEDIDEPKPTKLSVKKFSEHLSAGLIAPFYIIFRLQNNK
jgi:ubiquinone/menaquinone biosynthesis C-methylase UbiE